MKWYMKYVENKGKWPKYLGNNTRCPVKLFCHETGRWSLLPTFGITSVSDNTCDWDDFAKYCKRVGLTDDVIHDLSCGRCYVNFFPMEGRELVEIAPIGVCDAPCAKGETMWIYK